MKRRDYEVFYIFEILSAAKHGISKKKLRDKVSCNGVKYKSITKMLIEKQLLEETPIALTSYRTTDIGRDLLNQWNSILTVLGIGDLLCLYM
jgi:predicted transcriptional regulator